MKVAIIGAGFGGLAAGLRLARMGIDVRIFESESLPGGLAVGFKKNNWRWSLEKHYHHWFTSDKSVRNLAEEIGHKVYFKRVKTSIFVSENIYQLDSVLSLLLLPEISFFERIRMGTVVGYLRLTPFWQPLEKITAKDFITKFMGKKVWKVIWEPLFKGKFHNFFDEIPASWFWARVKKRSSSLGYPEGGFLEFALNLAGNIEKLGGKIYYRTKVSGIKKGKNGLVVKVNSKDFEFHKVICTLPSYNFVKITHGLSPDYIQNLLSVNALGSVNMVLSLKKEFLRDKTYWLNVNNEKFPFLAIVEHTNFMDRDFYAGEHLVYIGNYLPHQHQYFRKEAVELFKEFYPYLKTINPHFDKSQINNIYLFKAYFSQPAIPLNYSKKIPSFETPIEGLYLCNINQVYPWDRGTNYAVENALKVAKILLDRY